MTRPTLITVIGKSAKDPRDPVPEKALRMAEEVGKLIAERGGVLVSGGLSGVMEAASRGAKTADGLVVGILPGFDKPRAGNLLMILVVHLLQPADDIAAAFGGIAEVFGGARESGRHAFIGQAVVDELIDPVIDFLLRWRAPQVGRIILTNTLPLSLRAARKAKGDRHG